MKWKTIVIETTKKVKVFSETSELKMGMFVKDIRDENNYYVAPHGKVIGVGKDTFVVKWFWKTEKLARDYREFEIYDNDRLDDKPLTKASEDEVRVDML